MIYGLITTFRFHYERMIVDSEEQFEQLCAGSSLRCADCLNFPPLSPSVVPHAHFDPILPGRQAVNHIINNKLMINHISVYHCFIFYFNFIYSGKAIVFST